MNKQNRANASLFGKTAAVVADKDKLSVYTTGTWIIILSVWVFGFAFFLLAFPIDSIIFVSVATAVGGILGFFLVKKLYIGKLTHTFLYEDVDSFISSPPEFTVAQKNKQLFELKMMPKAQIKLLLQISTAIAENEFYELVKVHSYYRIQPRKLQNQA